MQSGIAGAKVPWKPPSIRIQGLSGASRIASLERSHHACAETARVPQIRDDGGYAATREQATTAFKARLGV